MGALVQANQANTMHFGRSPLRSGPSDSPFSRSSAATLASVKVGQQVKDWLRSLGAALLLGGLGSQAAARTVAIGGVAQAKAVDSKLLSGGEMLAVWTLPRLGISVRNDPLDVRLLYGSRELRYTPAGKWVAVGFKLSAPLPDPQLSGVSLYVPLAAIKLLGIRVLGEASDVLDFAAPAVVPVVTLPPSPEMSTSAATKAPVTPPKVTVPKVTVPKPAPPAVVATIKPVPVAPTPTPPAPEPSPAPAPQPVPQPVIVQPAQPIANLDTVRISRTMHRGVEVQRVVLELSGPAPQTITREKAGLGILLANVSASPSQQELSSGDTLSVEPGAAGVTVRLSTGGGTSEIMTLDDPFRVVIDTTTLLDSSVPPPIDPESLPAGVTYRNKGYLHLLSFDPALYQPRVVSAPLGRSSDVATLVKSVQGVAGVNGGYFDTASDLPVDLVVMGGLMTAPSLERRATVGFTAAGETLVGYPRPRYTLSGSFGTVMVNSVGSKVRPELLTAFVGDGRTTIGADNLTTLYVSLNGQSIQNALTGRVIPPTGTLALTFDPARFPQLPRAAGQPLTTTLDWRASDAPWNTAFDALSAGPLLVQGGKVVLNPSRENFNTLAGIWRPTRQVAFGLLGGQPTIAYFEHGTPEEFAAVLAGAGLQSAVRMDSGSSATAYLIRGYGNLGGYLNTVWSQNVPNAIVFVPRASTAKGNLKTNSSK